MYARILVTVDGSSTSNLALQHACGLARDQKAKLHIVHVVDEVNINVETPAELSAFRETARQAGLKILEEAKAAAGKAGIDAETKLLEIETFGHRVADTVLREARAWSADIIVLGTHGRRGLHHALLGSVAEGIVRISSLPVLLIRGK